MTAAWSSFFIPSHPMMAGEAEQGLLEGKNQKCYCRSVFSTLISTRFEPLFFIAPSKTSKSSQKSIKRYISKKHNLDTVFGPLAAAGFDACFTSLLIADLAVVLEPLFSEPDEGIRCRGLAREPKLQAPYKALVGCPTVLFDDAGSARNP
jgi:hypothetical protein